MQVVMDELDKPAGSRPRSKIDIITGTADLSTQQGSGRLQHFSNWNNRFVALLAERNRRAAEDTHDFVYQEMPLAIFQANSMEVL